MLVRASRPGKTADCVKYASTYIELLIISEDLVFGVELIVYPELLLRRTRFC